jgi:hypothetical protein
MVCKTIFRRFESDHGYDSRKHYLECMAEEYGIPVEVVFSLTQMLGPNEDFDGLINALEDAEGVYNE